MKPKLTIQNAHLFLESMDLNQPKKKVRNACDDCGNSMTIENYFYVCVECGLMDVNNPLSNDEINNNKKKTLYKRKIYFIEKLKMMCGLKQSRSTKYFDIINELKTFEINNIHDLKKVMKKLFYSSHYKYIYDIYKDLKGINVIDITEYDILIITDRFLKIEESFKNKKRGRKNMISYDLIIRNIMKELGYKCYKNIIIPQKNRNIKRIYNSIKYD
jgi:hypothetical protein